MANAKTAAKPVKATGRIKITKVPEGEAPLWVRQAWVGLELPCDPIMGYPDQGDGNQDRGAVSQKHLENNRYGVSVPQEEALLILEKKNPAAAKWWRDHGLPEPGNKYFGFDEGEVEIISGVKRQVIQQYLGVLELGVGAHDGQVS